ncbi:MAG: glycosyltransferase family 2 protein, partial [Acidobacteriota bacterium]
MTSPARWRRLLGRLVGRAKPDESPRGPFARAARFDPSWYLLTYPDARQAVDAGRCADALTHYRTLGAAAAYDPNPRFSEVGYRRSYPEVIAAIEAGHSPSGFEHFAGLGRFEGRPPNDWPFDSDFYLAHYPDAAQAIAAERFTSALEHYWEVGAGEGRDPHAVFSEVAYRQRYPDVAAGIAEGRYLCAYQHFLCYGAEEGRQPHPLFDEAHYRHLHPDIDDGIRDGTIADAYFHLATLGLAEGRRWKTADEDARLRQAATRLARCRLDELLASERRIDLTPPDEPAVSVLVVLFGRAELSLACFESLTRLRDPSFELIVVDNASTDRTPRLLDRLQGARILRNDDNFGFTRAANQAAAEARGEMLLFLNNDAELLPSSLVAAVNRLRAESEAGAVGGRVLGLDGKLQEAGSIVWRDGTTGGYGRGDEPTHGAYLFPRPVDYCSGVFLLTRRRTFEALGGFDAAFEPAYYEESDYCFRLRAAGHTVFYEPRSLVLHHGAASLPDATHLSRMLADHRQIFAERHAEALAEAYPATTANLFPASDRRRFRGRVLVLDDHVPLEALGGGSPRQQEILHTLCELGFFVTFFATNPTRLDLEAALAELPAPNLELIHDLGRPKFPDFWQERREAYDILIVSRQHNFRCLLEDGFDPSQERVRLIYDAESVAARRRQAQLELLGPDVPQESEVDVDDELRLAHRAPEIWAVSVA